VRDKNLKWLFEELPNMIDSGLITTDQSARIRDHYLNSKTGKPNLALVVFSILGSVLLAGGIILILAHNWAEIPRSIRTAIAFIPIVSAQLIGSWVLRKRPYSLPWTEGISAFALLSVGAAIALISQIYHIIGDLESYLLIWMLLSIPLVYVFSSVTAAVLYTSGITAWVIADRIAGDTAAGFWILLLLILPMYYLMLKRSLVNTPTSVLGWFISISVVCGGTLATGSITAGSWVIMMISLFLSLFSLGVILFPLNESVWKTPFYRIGILGLVITYGVLSYRGVWGSLSFRINPEAPLTCYLGAGVIGVITVTLSIMAIRKSPVTASLMVIGLPITLISFQISNYTIVTAILFSLYMFVIGVVYLVQGLRVVSGRMLNFGFLLIAASVILRFFDSDWSFTLRGIVFSVLGAGFLIANLFVVRRRGVRT
jgi:uncharacterized membrane protein